MTFQPGWYPDYAQPGAERWHNGQEWTSMVRPAPPLGAIYQDAPTTASGTHHPYAASSVPQSGPSTAPTPSPEPDDSTPAWLKRLLYGIAGALALWGAIAAWNWLTAEVSTGEGSDLWTPSLSSYTCQDLADEAVAGSSGQAFGPHLLDVRDPQIVEDYTDDYTLPTGTDEVLVLKCQGLGIWSSADRSPVVLKLTADADGQPWIAWGPPGTI